MRLLLFVVLLLSLFLTRGSIQAQSENSGEIRVHLSRAEAALRVNDTATAEREFHAALSLNPHNAEANTNLGIMALSRGDYPSACTKFRTALAAQPSLTKTEALLGICGRRIGDPEAAKHLEHAFSKLEDPRLRTQVGMELVGIYYAEGDPERAVSVTQKLVELNPENPDILYAAQRLYSELADATLNKLAIVAPNSARMQQVIAERLINAGDMPSAIDHYKQALQLDPRLQGVRYELAQAILESSRFDAGHQADAIAMAEEAEKVEGKSANLECLLARIALLQDNDAKAGDLYRQALALDPGNAEAQVGLARVLMSQNKPAEARKYLLMAIHSDPLDTVAHYRLAMVDRKLGLHEEAQKEADLSRDIKTTRDNIERLYIQMHKQSRQHSEEQDTREDTAN